MTRRHTLAVFRIALRTLRWGTLAAALLVAGVWVRSEWAEWHTFLRMDGCSLSIDWQRGGVRICRSTLIHKTIRHGDVYLYEDPNYVDRIWVPAISGMSGPVQFVHVPYWLPVSLFASISGGLFWRDRRAARRAKVGMCPSCGYSRAGLALDAVCPECGKPKA